MNIAGFDIGVCSWSLRPASMADLAEKTRALGLAHVQLALGGLMGLDEPRQQAEVQTLRDAGINIVAGMIGFRGENYSSIAMIRATGGLVPDSEWPARREVALAAAPLAARLGISRVSTHVGFIPPSSNPQYTTMLERMREIARAWASEGVLLLMETGQEAAGELLQFLNDLACRNVGVNFDPANMILYGAGDPIEAVQTLGRHIRHVHIKDGELSDQPGVTWGREVPFGTGQVKPKAFLAALKEVGYTGSLSIEREGGEDRVADVQEAIETLRAAAEE